MTRPVRRLQDLDADKAKFRGIGISGTATKTTTTNIDYKLTEDRFFHAVQLILKNHTIGDSVKVQIVDVDNILGYGAGAVLDEFASSWFVAEDSQLQPIYECSYIAEIPANLYIRIKYTSIGISQDVSVYCNLFLHKPLI